MRIPQIKRAVRPFEPISNPQPTHTSATLLFPSQTCHLVPDLREGRVKDVRQNGGERKGPTYKSACHDIELSDELMSRSSHQLQHGAQRPKSTEKQLFLGDIFQRAHQGEDHHQVISRGPSNRDEANFPFPNRLPPFRATAEEGGHMGWRR